VGGTVFTGAAVVLVAAVGVLVVAGTAVVLVAVMGVLVVVGAGVVGGATEVLVDCAAEVVEDRSGVGADDVARVLDGRADVGPDITELAEGAVGMATPETGPSVSGADLVWKLITAARPAIVAPTTIGARFIGFAPGLQPST